MNWVLAFVPMGLVVLAGQLMARDKNTTGADDAFGRVINQIAPIVPSLIEGQANENTADKVFLAIFKTSQAYLLERGKLPE